jgi:hypothetical protein
MNGRLLRAALALVVVMVACSAEVLPPKGQIMLVITTNLAPPKDFDKLDLTIVDGETELKYGPYEMGGSQPTKLPATFAIVAGSDPNRAVRIKLEASRAGAVRIRREAIVRVPPDRIASLPLPVDGLCVDLPACPPDANNEPQTCIAGRCETAKVDETKLPDYAPAAVFGGGTGNGDGQCFDTIACFAGGKEATVDPKDCSIAKELGGSGTNIAVVRPFTGDGVCAPMACLIPLDRDPFTDPTTFFTGWREDGQRLRLPPGVCERSFPVMVSTSCPTKSAPTCGTWSAVGTDTGLSLPIPFDAAVFGEGGSAPPNVPASLTFIDGDVREGFVKGNVVIGRAPDESGITGYRLYWADGPDKKLDPIATLPKTGADIGHPLEGPMFAESSHLYAVSYSANGEIAPHLSTGPIDNFVRQRGIDVQAESIDVPSTLIDAKNQRLLIVGQDEVASRQLPSLVSCQLDGTGCIYRDLTNGQTTGKIARRTGAVIDETNDKLLVVTDGGNAGSDPTLFRCNRDGTNCDGAKDLGAPSMAGVNRINVAVDDVNKKFLASFNSGGSGGTIVRCDLDGSNCTFPPYGGGIVNQSDGDIVIDKVGQKILVVRSATGGSKPYLFKCDIDGSSCGVKDISAGSPVAASGVTIAIDEKNQKLIVVTFVTNSPTLQFYRCNLDGEGCITRTLPNAGVNAPLWPHLVVDAAHEKIFMFTYGSSNAVYQRCELDGTGCTAEPTTANFGMLQPRAALYDGKLFVVGAKNGPGADFATFLAY